tara:strand:+ start:76 stop:624 length:549 start_codon:yes stop_codon:yes gene_type:complete
MAVPYLGAALVSVGTAPAFGTDPKYRSRIAAVENYTQHIEGMGWPEELVDALAIEANYAPANDAAGVYEHMYRMTPEILMDLQIPQNDVRNYQKNQNWLKAAGEASNWTATGLDDARWSNILWETTVESTQDARALGQWGGKVVTEAAEGARAAAETTARNPWPVVIGIALTGLILRRAKII